MTIACVMAGASLHAEPMPIGTAAKLFGARPSTMAAVMSPSGQKIVSLSGTEGARTEVRLYNVATGETRLVIGSPGRPESLQWCEFASEDWLVCRYGGNIAYHGLVIGLSRLAAIDLVKGSFKPLGVRETENDAGIKQDDGAVIDWLPDGSSASVLMARTYVGQDLGLGSLKASDRQGLGVDQIDLATMKVDHVEQARPAASRYVTDGHGTVRIMGLDELNSAGNLSGRVKYRYRTATSRDWRDLGVYDSRDNSGLYPLAVDHDSDTLYYLQHLQGRDALYRMKLDGSGVATMVAHHPSVDIDNVVRVARGRPVIGYRYTDDRTHTVYFNQDYQRLAVSLAKALPTTPLIDFAGSSADGTKLLVHGASDTDPGAYYYLDRTTHEMKPVLLDRPELEGQALATVRSISVPTADGKSIPAYLTISGDGPAKGRPGIVLPHGGPSSRDEWGFDWLAQFLAARGYAVIQPNYRGSAGYGDDFIGDNAFRDWKTAMADIGAAADYLGKSGIADPARLAIVGWSYGGYAALQSAVIDPARYKAVVAIAPVTDLSALRRDAEGFTNENLAKDFIGKGANLQEGSPLHHAAAIRAPVLLVHADMDANVRIAHSQRMAAALRKAGTPVEFLSYKGLEHQLDDSLVRTEMLTRIGLLLDATIGH